MKILQAPNKILNQKTQAVPKVDSEVMSLIGEMWKLMDEAKGVGLAAPQVGKSISLAIIGFEPTAEMLEKNPKLVAIPKITLINPKIVWNSKDTSIEKEGCLSCGKIEVEVPRFKKIHVEHLDENGKKKKTKARGMIARAMQHEIDHLQGRLITDYQKSSAPTTPANL